ncbi:hypothetical protein Pve01_29300 [Planomonospora venezuelensis]|nr:hypothetical protein Pve01_29300 [Planomonospora venezuelensis]
MRSRRPGQGERTGRIRCGGGRGRRPGRGKSGDGGGKDGGGGGKDGGYDRGGQSAATY